MSRYKMLNVFIVLAMCALFVSGCSFSTDSYNYESAYAQFNKGNHVEAKKYIDKVVYGQVDSDEKKDNNFKKDIKAEYLNLAGHIYIEGTAEDIDVAIDMFNAAIKESGQVTDIENNKEAYRGMGLAYAKKGEYESAIAQYDKALDVKANESSNKDIMKYKIEAVLYSNKGEEAIKLCDSYLQAYGKDSEINTLRGLCYGYMKDEENMLKYMNEVIKNGNNSGYYNLAKCYMKMGNYQKAYENYEIYAKKATGIDTELIALSMIDCLVKMEELDKALELVGSYFKEESKNTYDKELRTYYVTILEKKGNYAEALAKAQEYMNIYKDDVDMQKEITFIQTRISE